MLFLVFLSIFCTFTIAIPIQSPCPNYFQYVQNESETFGLVDVPPVKVGETLKLQIFLSIATLIADKNYGSMELQGTNVDLLEKVKAGQNIQYKIKFPMQDPLPKVTKIMHNEDVLCVGPGEKLTYEQNVTTISFMHTFSTKCTKHPNSLD